MIHVGDALTVLRTMPDESVHCTVLDPFGGAGTTGLVAAKLNREWVLIELKPEYAAMAERRIREALPLFMEASPAVGGQHRAGAD